MTPVESADWLDGLGQEVASPGANLLQGVLANPADVGVGGPDTAVAGVSKVSFVCSGAHR